MRVWKSGAEKLRTVFLAEVEPGEAPDAPGRLRGGNDLALLEVKGVWKNDPCAVSPFLNKPDAKKPVGGIEDKNGYAPYTVQPHGAYKHPKTQYEEKK